MYDESATIPLITFETVARTSGAPPANEMRSTLADWFPVPVPAPAPESAWLWTLWTTK
jgi:hypothetical protein